MAGFTIERLSIPASLDAEGGADFAASVDVRNASEIRKYGTDEVAYPADELLPHWHDPHEPKSLWVARLDGRIVARAIHETQLGDAPAVGDGSGNGDGSDLGDGSEVGWITVEVHPDAEGRGIGRALFDEVERYGRSLGETRLLLYTASPDGPGERVTPPTGFGSLPAANREVRLLLARGYTLEQVERGSRYPLGGVSDLDAAVRSARDVSGPDYELHRWVGPTAHHWLDDMATLLTRMSTDAPTAGLEEPEDVWTAHRVAERDARIDAGPRFEMTTAVEHRPTGRLVGFTQLDVPRDPTRAALQGDTLVLREHRGHSLGMLLKVANLQLLEQEAPGHPSVLTWNAEENRYMLRVNEQLGFVPIGYEGAWRLDL